MQQRPFGARVRSGRRRSLIWRGGRGCGWVWPLADVGLDVFVVEAEAGADRGVEIFGVDRDLSSVVRTTASNWLK